MSIYSPGTCDRWYAENIYKFTFPGIGANLTYMVIEGLVLLLFVIFVEVRTMFIPSNVHVLSFINTLPYVLGHVYMYIYIYIYVYHNKLYSSSNFTVFLLFFALLRDHKPRYARGYFT